MTFNFIAVQQMDQIVKLNVRGKFFVASKITFDKYQESNFQHFIKDMNESGVVFIEQDPVLFENILDFFRFGKISQLAKLAKLKKSVDK